MTVPEWMPRPEAEDQLRFWRRISDSRDGRVRMAYRSGVSKAEIAHLTGLARSTIDRILK